MPEKIWKKYEKIKEIPNNNIKTYLARIEPIIKEIKLNDKDDYLYEKLEKLKKEIKVYDIIEENEIIYLVIDNNQKSNNIVDNLLLTKEFDIKKEGIVEGHSAPILKDEIINLFKMEKCMCKIESRTKKNEIKLGSGFFCKLNNFPIKYALFTNNHVLEEYNIEINKTIKFDCLQKNNIEINKTIKGNYLDYQEPKYISIKKEIKITEKRRVYTNVKLDYTCIELFESDGIKDYFEIDPDLFKYDNKEILKNNDIFILQYPKGNDISFSCGQITLIEDNLIKHNASTEGGSSGSPIIRRSYNNYVIGLHFGGKKEENKYSYNVATNFVYILENIKEEMGGEINCIYIADKNKNEIDLLHDYNEDVKYFDEEERKSYLEVKKLNKNIFEKI